MKRRRRRQCFAIQNGTKENTLCDENSQGQGKIKRGET